ncbi:MAG: hypothetical protein H7335_21185 [Massilia sp.]|nr:hypothetical protein [Massilia sp.]
MAAFKKTSWLRPLAALLLLWCALAGQAQAAMTINSILVNGVAAADVAPGSTITVSVTVTISGGTRWRSTSFSTTPASISPGWPGSPDVSAAGTYTRTFTMTAPTQSGVFSLNVFVYTNPNYNGSAVSKTLPNGINTGPVVLSLNHVRIVHDGSGLTCAPETITLKACANAACTTLFTANTSVTLGAAGTWSPANPVVISNGSRTVTLSNSTVGTVNLSGTVNSPSSANTAAVCYNGSVANSCAIAFTNTACSLDAVEPAKGANTPIYTKRVGSQFALDLLALTNGVINTSSTTSITATLVQGSAAGCSTTALSAPITVSASAGRATVLFPAVSIASRNVRVRLESPGQIGCSSDNFALRPTSLIVTGSANHDPTGLSATAGTPSSLKAGGSTFTLTARPLPSPTSSGTIGYDGTPVIDANMAEAAVVNAGPPVVVGNAGSLSGAFSAASAASAPSNTASGSAFTYSEVGYFRLLPYGAYDDTFASVDALKSPADCFTDANLGAGTAAADPNVVAAGGRVGCYFGSAQSAYFGRFVPDHFAVTVKSMLNRSGTAACAASSFTYMGEPLTQLVTLEAQNAANDVTTNYTGAYARLNPLTQLDIGVINDPVSGARTPFKNCITTPGHPCFTPGAIAGSFADGAAELVVPLTVFRGAAPAGPFASVKIAVAPADPDSVKLAAYDLDTVNLVAGSANHVQTGDTILRYGRLSIDNAYGSELLKLTMKVNAQYWNGTGYASNTLDSCTPPLYAPLSDYRGGVTALNLPSSSLTPGSPLALGAGALVLVKPAPAPVAKGSVKLTSGYPEYLPGYGRATFGVYKAGPVIYVRETY